MKIVIAFISPFSRDFDPSKAADEYHYQDGVVSGRQTNEAPLKYLMQKDPEIDEILCICTPEVLKQNKFGISPYDYIQESVTEEYPDVMVLPIEFSGENFEKEVIPAILESIAPDDSIYLDTTGGPRHAVSQLILLTQVLQYQGTMLLGAVYSNYQNKTIEDVTANYRTFDLITGLNEFRHYCSTALLEKYYKDSELAPLIQSMKELAECVLLCRTRTGLLEERIAAFKEVLQKTKMTENITLQVLIPIFEEKFRFLSSVPDIVQWCLDNNMILQALTIYNDCIPEYFIRQRGLLDIPENVLNECGTKPPYMYALTDLNKGFFSLGKKPFANGTIQECWHQANQKWAITFHNSLKMDYGVWLAHNMNVNNAELPFINPLFQNGGSVNGFHVNISHSQMREFCMNYMYINLLRNQLNHDGGEMVGQKSRIWYMTEQRNRRPLEDISIDYVKTIVSEALAQLKECRKNTK